MPCMSKEKWVSETVIRRPCKTSSALVSYSFSLFVFFLFFSLIILPSMHRFLHTSHKRIHRNTDMQTHKVGTESVRTHARTSVWQKHSRIKWNTRIYLNFFLTSQTFFKLDLLASEWINTSAVPRGITI